MVCSGNFVGCLQGSCAGPPTFEINSNGVRPWQFAPLFPPSLHNQGNIETQQEGDWQTWLKIDWAIFHSSISSKDQNRLKPVDCWRHHRINFSNSIWCSIVRQYLVKKLKEYVIMIDSHQPVDQRDNHECSCVDNQFLPDESPKRASPPTQWRTKW